MPQPATDWLNSEAVKQSIPVLATLLGSGLTMLFNLLTKLSTDKNTIRLDEIRHEREQAKALAVKKSEVAKEIIAAVGATETALAKYTALYRDGLNFYKPLITDEIRPKLDRALIEISDAIEKCLTSKPLVEILGDKNLINSFELYKTGLVTFNRLIRLHEDNTERTPNNIQIWHGRIDSERFKFLSLLRPIYLGETLS
jgi:hypothetical protein